MGNFKNQTFTANNMKLWVRFSRISFAYFYICA